MDFVKIKRLFEPSTRQNLPVAVWGCRPYSALSTHKGVLQFSSELGQGSSFLIYFPLHSSDFVEAPLKVAAAKQEVGTILLAEDESQLRESAKALIEKFRRQGLQRPLFRMTIHFFADIV